MRKLLALLIFFLALSQEAAFAQTPNSALPRIDFKQALKLALEKSPEYTQAEMTFKSSRLKSSNAWATLFPQLDLRASHSLNRFGLITAPNTVQNEYGFQPWDNRLGVYAKEQLSETFEQYRSARIADLELEQNRLNFERVKSRLLADVAKSYYDYSEAASNYELQVRQQDLYNEQYKTSNTRYRQGMSASRDFLRAKADKQRQELNVLNQGYQLSVARESLKALIGDTGSYDFIPYDSKLVRPESMQFPNVSPDSTLDYRIAQTAQDIAKIQYDNEVYKYWPRLSVEVGADYTQPNYLESWRRPGNDGDWNFNAAIVVEFNLWDWGIRRRNVEIARNQITIETAIREKERITVRQNLTNYGANKTTLMRTFSISTQILRDSEEVYRGLNLAYRSGKASYLDLQTALQSLFESRSNDLKIRFEILKLRADLAYYEGNAYEVLTAP